jgi:Leucine-rich repeat (LRR) protein
MTIKCIIINDYPPLWTYDYSAIHSMHNLTHLSIYTTDKKEIDFSAFPFLDSVALNWRPKAKSLFYCVQLRHLFLGRYIASDLTNLSNLKNLKYLRINTGSVVSLNGLRVISGLEELMLMQVSKLEDIEDLLELKNLKRLRIDNCKRVKNINAIKMMGIPRLEIAGTTPS